jgi:hypothetical protein
MGETPSILGTLLHFFHHGFIVRQHNGPDFIELFWLQPGQDARERSN